MKKKIETNFFCKSRLWSRRMKKIKKIVSEVLLIDDFGFKNNKSYFLNLIFVDDKKIKLVNKIYRRKNKPTDVLSFPYFRSSYLKSIKENNIYIGDIAISYEIIKKRSSKNNFKFEFDKVWIHGLLHLIGYDHIKNKDYFIMERTEKKILNLISK